MKYDNIINYNYTGSKRKNKMSLEERSAQFSSFQALEGYSDDVKETERITQDMKYLDESLIEEINNKIKYVYENNILAEYTYFIKDNKKSGGHYNKIVDYIKKIDTINSKIVLKNGEIINFIDIVDVYIK